MIGQEVLVQIGVLLEIGNPATVPTVAEDVVIPNVANKPVISSGTNAVAKNIIVNNGATLTINQGGTLTVAQTLTNNGTLTSKSNASGDGSLITNTLAGNGSYKIERYLKLWQMAFDFVAYWQCYLWNF